MKDEFAEKINKQLTENVLEDIFKFAAAKRMNEIADDYPTDDILEKEVEISPEFSNRMMAHFNSLKRREKRKHNTKMFLKVASIIIVFLLISTVVVLNVEALRLPVLKFFSITGEKSTTVKVKEDNADYGTVSEEINGLYLPSYLPDGYSVNAVDNENHYKRITYQNQNNDIITYQYIFEGDGLGIDSENAQIKQVPVNGRDAQLYLKNGFGTLLFYYGDNQFMLSGYIPESEIVKMAESLKYYN